VNYFIERDRGRWYDFPYCVYAGETNKIGGGRRVVHCAMTLRGAKRIIAKDKRQQVSRLVHVEYDQDQLPDLRVSQLAPP
jgi:hypothetical protein